MSPPRLLVLALAIVTGCGSLPKNPTLRPKLQRAFDEMKELVRSLDRTDESNVEEVKNAMRAGRELGRRMESFAYMLGETDRPALRAFARSPSTKKRPFPMAQLLMYAGEYEGAVEYLVPLLATTESPSYVMWKMFEELFGAEPDFPEQSQLIGRAFLNHHDDHPEDQALIRKLFQNNIESLRTSLRGFTETSESVRRRARLGPHWTEARLTAKLDRGEIRATGRLIRFRDIADWDYGYDLQGMPRSVRRLDGKDGTMVGFPSPETDNSACREFDLWRSPRFSGHVGPDTHEVVRVILNAPATLKRGKPVRVEGTFRVSPTLEDGFAVAVFRMENAQVSPVK